MEEHSSSWMIFGTKPVEQLSKQLKTNLVDSATLIQLVELAFRYWQGEEILNKDWTKIVNDSYLPSSLCDELLSGILNLLLSIKRIPDKHYSPGSVLSDLIQLGFSQEQAQQILAIRNVIASNAPQFLGLKGTKWRIDVTISTSHISRVLEPWILMELELKTGDKKTIHIPISQFHNLRFQVASCLNQLSQLKT